MLKTKKIVNSEYNFVRCLGEGLSSVVYEAVRSNSSGIQSERVAVKILKSENSVSWLQNEFESLRRVNSPNCVRVLGHESFEEGPGIILELIDGVTLFELGQKFSLSESEISQIGSQVCLGLRAIEIAGLAHGDLNPKNIILTLAGDVKLIDFGSFSGDTQFIGSLPYLSRRIWNGESASFESDLESWSLITCDLRSRFTSLPLTKEDAQRRASELVSHRNFAESTDAKESIAEKVSKLLSSHKIAISTSIVSEGKRSAFADPILRASLSVMLAALIFSAQNLLSEPLKAADLKPLESATLLVRTHAWTELSVNGKSKGYAPVTLQNLAPGNYRIKYKRSRGSGELVLSLKPGQKRLLRDSDFSG